jgi:hypothetical protein
MTSPPRTNEHQVITVCSFLTARMLRISAYKGSLEPTL